LESIAFRIKQCLDLIDIKDYELYFDGGMSNNKYLMNFISSLLNCKVNVTDVKDCTVVGVGYSAGLYEKIYKME